jgi:diacylglycerol kinase
MICGLITVLLRLELCTFQVGEGAAMVVVVEERVLRVEFLVAVLAIVVGAWWCLGWGGWVVIGTVLLVL